MNWTTWNKSQPAPLELLLEADPSEKQIAKYLEASHVFQLVDANEIIGVICLLPLNKQQLEIMNIAVKPSKRNQGIGKMLLEKAFDYTMKNGFSTIIVKTGNSSIDQLAFYQKIIFECSKSCRIILLNIILTKQLPKTALLA